MFYFCRSLEKNIQLLTSSVTPFGVPPSPKGKAYLPDKREFEKIVFRLIHLCFLGKLPVEGWT